MLSKVSELSIEMQRNINSLTSLENILDIIQRDEYVVSYKRKDTIYKYDLLKIVSGVNGITIYTYQTPLRVFGYVDNGDFLEELVKVLEKDILERESNIHKLSKTLQEILEAKKEKDDG